MTTELRQLFISPSLLATWSLFMLPSKCFRFLERGNVAIVGNIWQCVAIVGNTVTLNALTLLELLHEDTFNQSGII